MKEDRFIPSGIAYSPPELRVARVLDPIVDSIGVQYGQSSLLVRYP